LRSQAQGEPLVLVQRHDQLSLPAAFEMKAHAEANRVSIARGAGSLRHPAAYGALMGSKVLGRHDPFGELDEVVLDRAFGNPGGRIAEDPAACAPDREAEGTQSHLGTEATLREYEVRHC
jgi:hypothetical protein